MIMAAITDPINTLSGKSFLSYLAPSTQYLALFSEISSIFENDGSFLSGSEVPLKIRGATFTI
jgi:hypothetical protein